MYEQFQLFKGEEREETIKMNYREDYLTNVAITKSVLLIFSFTYYSEVNSEGLPCKNNTISYKGENPEDLIPEKDIKCHAQSYSFETGSLLSLE